jgi:pseudouridine-5'-phosphate glycosidase
VISWSAVTSAARDAGTPLVALESSVLAQGLQPPHNRLAHKLMCDAARRGGAEPAVTAVIAGRPSIGLDGEDLERFLTSGAKKVSARDLGHAMATGADGSTTVAASLALCAAAKIDVFATGGIGGVHRDLWSDDARPSYDESADLLELSRRSVITVCAGAKSILDLPATLERLETYGVTVIGYRTDEFPGFFTATTGLRVSTIADSARTIVRTLLAGRALGQSGSLLVVQPPPPAWALDPNEVKQAVDAALMEARGTEIAGAAVTPFLLGAVERATGGRSVQANLALLEANASLAAEIAVALAAESAAG